MNPILEAQGQSQESRKTVSEEAKNLMDSMEGVMEQFSAPLNPISSAMGRSAAERGLAGPDKSTRSIGPSEGLPPEEKDKPFDEGGPGSGRNKDLDAMNKAKYYDKVRQPRPPVRGYQPELPSRVKGRDVETGVKGVK